MVTYMNTPTETRRLVNATVLVRKTTETGHTYLTTASGAWGRPEDALAYAATMAGNTAANTRNGLEVLGAKIVDVRTMEAWVVTL